MRCPKCQSWIVRRKNRRSLRDALFRAVGNYPYKCGVCRYQFYSSHRHVPPQVIEDREASLDSVRIACSWGLMK